MKKYLLILLFILFPSIDLRSQDVSVDIPSDYEGLKQAYEKITEECKNIAADRENILIQTKKFLAEKNELLRAKEDYDNMVGKNTVLLDKVSLLEKENAALGKDIAGIKADYEKLLKEKDDLKNLLMKARKGIELGKIKERMNSDVITLKTNIRQAEKENKTLNNELEKILRTVGALEREKSKNLQEIDTIKTEVAELKKQNNGLELERKLFIEESRTFPAKIVKLNKQNEALIKETVDMHYNLGVFYVKNKEYDRALREFEKVLEINPHDPDAHYNIGSIYAKYLVNQQKAIKYFKKYLDLVPNAPDREWVKKYIITWQTWSGKEPID